MINCPVFTSFTMVALDQTPRLFASNTPFLARRWSSNCPRSKPRRGWKATAVWSDSIGVFHQWQVVFRWEKWWKSDGVLMFFWWCLSWCQHWWNWNMMSFCWATEMICKHWPYVFVKRLGKAPMRWMLFQYVDTEGFDWSANLVGVICRISLVWKVFNFETHIWRSKPDGCWSL